MRSATPLEVQNETISVVTGAAGFLGSALVRRLLASGDTVRALVLPNDPQAATLASGEAARARLEIVPVDVTDADGLVAALAGAARVFHTAALVHAWTPRERFNAVNVGGAQNVARAVLHHRVPRLVVISTTDVFGLPLGPAVLDESSPFRLWGEPYADSKIAAEQWLWECHRSGGLPLSVIYPGWIVGPGDRAFFPGLAEAIADGTMLFWYRGARLPFVYLDNLVDACLVASTAPVAVGNGYIVFDSDEGPTLEALCERIADVIGAPHPTRHIPYSVALTAAWGLEALWRLLSRRTPPPLRSVDVKAFGFQWHLSNAKAQRELGWAPRVPLAEGMRRALDDFAERYAASIGPR